ncbi:hypothetical protein HPB50_013559 [Hyalomma asiaticum]|uniref:Uncharacterized protein n=1 Tax=Hyalomma asiaticum TaxID=266040 RepID=A0ACB7S726_HYAAI|nr:hypothetical protein HPB50_013559 [Hyalomma asiaticum]
MMPRQRDRRYLEPESNVSSQTKYVQYSEEGQDIGYSSGTVKYPCDGHLAPDRTHARVIDAMRWAKGPEEPFEGFKGPSPFLKFKGLDLVWGLPPG